MSKINVQCFVRKITHLYLYRISLQNFTNNVTAINSYIESEKIEVLDCIPGIIKRSEIASRLSLMLKEKRSFNPSNDQKKVAQTEDFNTSQFTNGMLKNIVLPIFIKLS